MSQGRYPVPFVRHSVSQQQPPTMGQQPPIIMDVQRLVEHLKAEFRAELAAVKDEILTAIQQSRLPTTLVSPTATIQAPDLGQIYETVRRAVDAQGARSEGASQRDLSLPEETGPIFMPSDLLAPREGTVAVKTSDEVSGNLDTAAETLKRMKLQKK